MLESATISEALEQFKNHYQAGLGQAKLEPVKDIKYGVAVAAKKLRPDNYPMIFHHGHRTADVIVLIHGLSDSPYYMLAIGKKFYQTGLNVLLPLLPGHGLIDPDKPMEDRSLDIHWRREIDQAVAVAQLLGDRISLGGFSTGGALSLNKILCDPQTINGGLFLFSAALDLGILIEALSSRPVLRYLLQSYLRLKDGVVAGVGLNPYRFPKLPKFAGPELGQIIVENEKILRKWERVKKKIASPVFAAHSIQDTRVKIDGLLEVFRNHVKKGEVCLISQNVAHSDLVLAKDNPPDKANPKFDWMMANCLDFFKKYVSCSYNVAMNRNVI